MNYTAFNRLQPKLRERIEGAVLSVFAGDEYYKVPMEEIASCAGVSLATIYKYFGSKDGLLLSLSDYWAGLLTDRLNEYLEGMESTREKLRKVLWAQLDFYERNEEIGKIVFLTVPFGAWLMVGNYAQRPLVHLLLSVLKSGQRDGILNPSIPPVYMMDFIMGVTRRSFAMWIYRGKKYSLTGQNDALFQLVWNGVTNCES